MIVIHTREGHAPDLSDLPANKRWRSAQIGAEIGCAGPVRAHPRPRRAGLGDRPRGRPGPRRGASSTSPARARSTPPTSTWCCGPTSITHIVLTGITTDVCVHTTMREANDRGYECLILSDCTGATDPANHAAALHMVTMQGGVFGGVSRLGRLSSTADDVRPRTPRDERPVQPSPTRSRFDPATHRAGHHRHAARLRRARRLRRDPRQRRRPCCRPSSRRCRRCSPPPAPRA